MGSNYNSLNLIGHLQGLPNHILAHLLFTIPWNSSYKFLEFKLQDSEKKCHFLPLFTPGMKIKIQKPYCTSTRHTESLEYHLTTIWNVDGVQVTSPLWQKTSFIDPHGKMKIPNPYCTFARHVQSYPRVSIVYSWKCRWRSGDKLYRKKETSFFDHHLTTRDKNKIPKRYCTSTRHS